MRDGAGFFRGRQRYQLFNGVKYLVYALLSFNVYLFLQEVPERLIANQLSLFQAQP